MSPSIRKEGAVAVQCDIMNVHNVHNVHTCVPSTMHHSYRHTDMSVHLPVCLSVETSHIQTYRRTNIQTCVASQRYIHICRYVCVSVYLYVYLYRHRGIWTYRHRDIPLEKRPDVGCSPLIREQPTHTAVYMNTTYMRARFRHINMQTDIPSYIQACRHLDMQTYTHTYVHAIIHTNIQTTMHNHIRT